LKWAGSSGGILLAVNGVSYSRFDRMTFDGQGTAGVLVDQSKADGTMNYFDTGNEYTDNVFKNAGIAIRCGNWDIGCAETTVLRSSFLSNTTGIIMKNGNALDMWVWYCLFQNNGTGVSNTPGAGNFNVYNSVFQNSTTQDIAGGSSSNYNVRGNYSSGAPRSIGLGIFARASVNVQSNTILDTTGAVSIWLQTYGPGIFIDNVVRTLPTASSVSIGNSVFATAATGPVGIVGDNNETPPKATDLFGMGNTFTTGSGTCTLTSPLWGGGKCHEISDQIVSTASVNPPVPTLPVTPPNLSRSITEIVPGSTTAQIQAAINAATGTRPVVHIQSGNYNITSTLVVPANNSIQIIGDGSNSDLVWAGSGTGPVIKFLGPSKALMADIQINGNTNADSIEVDSADQPGSRIFMDEVVVGSSGINNVFVDALDYASVELHNFTHASTTGASVLVTGGTLAAAGNWQGGVTNFFCGDAAQVGYAFMTSNGAHLGVEDFWNETIPTAYADVTGSGTLSLSGAWLGVNAGSLVATLHDFHGTAAIANVATNVSSGTVNITGDGTGGKVLVIGLTSPATTLLNNTASPSPSVEFLNSATVPPGQAPYTGVPEIGCCDNTFLSAALSHLRTYKSTQVAPTPAGVTDLRLYRVYPGFSRYGIHLKAV
jgi:hypothetical protein